MTPTEQARIRDLVARNCILEADNERLRLALQRRDERTARRVRNLEIVLKRSCRMRQRAADQARFLHGVLIANGIEVPR